MRRKPKITPALAALLGLSLATGCKRATALYGVAAVDNDGDGFDNFEDCNDDDDSIYPGADDPLGDSIDQNCDGVDGDAQDTGT